MDGVPVKHGFDSILNQLNKLFTGTPDLATYLIYFNSSVEAETTRWSTFDSFVYHPAIENTHILS